MLAALNYMLAVALAAVAIVLTFVVATFFNFDIFPSSGDELKWIGIGIGAIAIVSFAVGIVIALVRIPFARRHLEHQVLRETGATISKPEDHVEVRNLLEALRSPPASRPRASPSLTIPRRTPSASVHGPRTRSWA